MATRLTDEFPARTKAPTAAYPDGSYMNETAPGANDGTPLDERIGDDYEGLKQSLLAKAGITPNGQPDSVTNPQQLSAIEKFDNDRQKETTGISEITEASIGLDIFPLIGQGLRVAGVGLWVVPSVTDDGSPMPNPANLDAVPTGTIVTINGGTTVNLYRSIEQHLSTADELESIDLDVGVIYVCERMKHGYPKGRYKFIGVDSDPGYLTTINRQGLTNFAMQIEDITLSGASAKLDGVEADDQSFLDFVALLKSKKQKARLGSGVCRITSPGSLSAVTTLDRGVEFEGDGRENFKLFFDYTGGFAYQNVAGQGDQFPTFKSMTFTTRNVAQPSDIPEADIRSGFVNLNSDGSEQGFRFDDCDILGFSEVYRFEGTNNASEFKWFGGSIKRCKDILILNNEQSLNHEFHGTDIEQYFGDLVKIEAGGGGSIKFFGGSIIPFEPGDGSTVTYLIRSSGNPSQNLSRGPVTFNDVRFELRDDNTRIFNIQGGSYSFKIEFEGGVMFTNSTETTNVYGVLDAKKEVLFSNVTFAGNTDSNLSAFNWSILADTTIENDGGVIGFVNSAIPKDTASKVSFTGNNGLVYADGCKVAERAPIANTTASDFHRLASPRGAGRGSIQPKTKRIAAHSLNNAGPTPTNTIDIDIPFGSRLIGFELAHDPGGPVDLTYDMELRSRDGVTLYANTGQYSYANGNFGRFNASGQQVSELRLTAVTTLTTPAFTGYIDILYR